MFHALGRRHLVAQDAVGADLAARHQVHLARDAVHLERRLERRVAGADHGDRLVLVQRAVTGGAVDHPEALELVLAGDLQPALGHAAGDDDRVGADPPARLELDDLAAALQAEADHILAEQALDGVQRHLLDHPLGQLGPGDVLVAGVVEDVPGDAHLAADVLGDEHGGETLARRVHGGGEACGAAADHRHVVDGLELGRPRPKRWSSSPVDVRWASSP